MIVTIQLPVAQIVKILESSRVKLTQLEDLPPLKPRTAQIETTQLSVADVVKILEKKIRRVASHEELPPLKQSIVEYSEPAAELQQASLSSRPPIMPKTLKMMASYTICEVDTKETAVSEEMAPLLPRTNWNIVEVAIENKNIKEFEKLLPLKMENGENLLPIIESKEYELKVENWLNATQNIFNCQYSDIYDEKKEGRIKKWKRIVKRFLMCC
eukprot:NODE_12_length_54577_cov_0.384100.p25 type:complete len:214 gc:universal NODE_12_length_54577_cov_0.384100:31637-30996(-)